MDFQGNPQPESGKLEQIIYQFLLKSLHVICDSRIPSLRTNDRGGSEVSSASRVRKSDKWFNLVLGDRPTALENLNFWHRNLMDPMIIDIILVHEGQSSSSVDNLYSPPMTTSTPVETVIERWVVQYESPRIVAPQTGAELSASFKKTYKKSIVLLRALYSHMRLLPAYRIFRQLSSSGQSYSFDVIHKVSSSSGELPIAAEERLEEYSFPSVEAFPGRLSVSVTYRPILSDFNLEPSTAVPPKIISDYVGSPATDPMRSFPVSEKGVRATSFPLRGPRPPSSSPSPSPFDRPHSWTSGFHRAAAGPFPGSPPVYRPSPTSSDFPSSPVEMYGNRAQSYNNNRMLNNQKGLGGYDEYQLSPPFSPSPSPSPPAYFYGGSSHNQMQSRKGSDTAPVTIPASMMAGRSSRYLSPNFSDPSRNPLPPLSLRSTRNDLSSHESPTGIRSFRRIEPPRVGEIPSAITNHHTGPKLIRDGKDDSGRFSGPLSSSGSPRVGFSRSSSRLSFQDDMDDLGFSCAFDVDDVDPPDFQASQSLPSKRATESTPMGRKSQDAAVGVLVHMLRTAPPLRQDSSCYSADTFKADPDGGLATASSFFVPRKAADALEELRSYREMKDLLLSKSGIGVVGKEET